MSGSRYENTSISDAYNLSLIHISTSNAYEYNNSTWGDVLTSYNGQSITYDELGNPLTYRDGISMTWKNGCLLYTSRCV